jgi:flagellar FliJ protein
MNGFKFKFQKILDYREHLETQEKHKFAAALKKYTDKENLFNTSKTKRSEYLKNSRGLMEKGDFLGLVHRDKARNALILTVEDNKGELLKERENLNRARAELLEFTKKKKIMEKLREKSLEKYKTVVKKNSKKEIDEVSQNIYLRKDEEK